jgi:hypothetical protein
MEAPAARPFVARDPADVLLVLGSTTASGSSALTSPMASSASRQAASSTVRVDRSVSGSDVSSPIGLASSPSRNASPASSTRPKTRPSTWARARRAARATSSAESSAAAAPVTRSTNSCASSTTRRSCSGSSCRPASMSTANKLWLVTTMSALRARVRDASAKHSSPNGHRCAPMHSRAGMETSRHAASSTPGSSSFRSPSVVVSAHSRIRVICWPSRPAWASHFGASSSSNNPPSGSSAFAPSSRARQR